MGQKPMRETCVKFVAQLGAFVARRTSRTSGVQGLPDEGTFEPTTTMARLGPPDSPLPDATPRTLVRLRDPHLSAVGQGEAPVLVAGELATEHPPEVLGLRRSSKSSEQRRRQAERQISRMFHAWVSDPPDPPNRGIGLPRARGALVKSWGSSARESPRMRKTRLPAGDPGWTGRERERRRIVIRIGRDSEGQVREPAHPEPRSRWVWQLCL